MIVPTVIRRARFAVCGLVVGVLACHDILKANDPDILLDANSKAGAQALRNGVFLRLSQVVNGIQGPDALFVYAGLMADEWRSGDTFVQRNNQDQRVFQPDNTFNAAPLRGLNRVRSEGFGAIRSFRNYWPDSTGAVASMFALVGYTETLMGELYCNGTPMSQLDGAVITYGEPLTNDSVLALAVANSDSAITLANQQVAAADAALVTARTAADTTRIRKYRTDAIRYRDLASISKGRALVDRGQFAAAAAAVTGVATTFKWFSYHSTNATTDQVWALNNSARRYTMTNGPEGGAGIDFVTPNDPRLPRIIGGATVFDTSVPMTLVRQGLYGQFDSIPIVTGVEARLIEAEANLQTGGDRAAWLTAINTLRTNATLYPPLGTGLTVTRGPALTALADPGTDSARISAHFRERAFWMFSTGHRLGDMRRLLRQYGRTEAQVYPNGAFVKGGNYGDALQLPVAFDEQNNPNFTGCLNRNP